MRQGFVFSLCVMLTVCASVWGVGGNMGGADPNGSPEKPYLIEDLADFDTFANPTNAATYWAAGVHTKLMTDIDLSGRTYTTAVIAPDTDTEAWWHQGTPFTGVFDGNNKAIQHFRINQPDISQIGIFGAIKTVGRVSNLNITDVNIIGNDYIAGLAGHIDNATVENCSVSGILRCEGYTAGGLVAGAYTSSTISNCQSTVIIHSVGHTVGGLVGENDHSSITNCYSWATVSGDWANLGGLIGTNYGGTIVDCFSKANIFITDPYVDYVGGLLGYSSGGLISSCWSNSQTTGRNYTGGLIGCTSYSCAIENSYSNGQVNGDTYVGGLVGITSWSSNETFTYCYSSCFVNGNTSVGGLIGEKNANVTLTSCFWDVENSGTTIAYTLRTGSSYPYTYTPIYNIPGVAEGKTTAEMMTQSTFTGWDFDPDDGDSADWKMLRPGEDTPRLAWQEVFLGDIAGLYGVDMVDFARLAGQWNEPTCNESNQWCQGADIDHLDGVDIKDLAAVAEDWLK